MNNVKILEFYNKIFSDPVVRSELTKTSKKIKNKEDLKKFIKAEIIPLARENGFSFSEEDLVDYESETLKKLKAEDLYNVSGGASFKTFLMSGGILSALFLSAGLTSGQIADAFIDLKDVKESGAAMERAIRNSVQQNAQAQANNQQNGSQTQGNNNDDDDDNSNSNEPIDNDKYSYNVDLWAFAKVAQDIITGSSSFNENDFLQKNDVDYNYNDNNNHNISDNAEFNNNDNNASNNAGNGANALNNNGNNNEISVTLPKNIIKNSIDENRLEILQNSKVDVPYVLEACNLYVPFIDCNYSEAEDKERFVGGYTQGITVGGPGGDGVAAAEYNKYYGHGYPSFMTILFPSSGGTLNIAGGYPGSYPLYKTCLPTPEMMGIIIAYFHYYRSLSPEDQEKEQAELSMYIQEIDSLDKTFLRKQKEFLGIKRRFYEELKAVKEHNKNASKKDKRNVKFTKYARLLKGVDNELFAAIENAEKKKSTQKPWQWNEESMINLINGFEEEYGYYSPSAKKFIGFFNEKLKFDVVRHIDERKINLYSFARVFFKLLFNGNYAISNQEETGDAKSDLENGKFLPKYAVEHSIGAFFIHLGSEPKHIYEFYSPIVHLCQKHNTIPDNSKDANEIQQNRNEFYGPIAPQSLGTGPNDNKDASENQQNINTIIQLCLATDPDDNKDANENQQNRNEFYGPIVPQSLETGPNYNKDASENQQNINTIATDSDNNKDIHAILAKMGNFKKLLETIKENPNSPYKSATREHEGAYHVVKDDQGNVYFSNDTFMDCADIASRHIINLISYDKSDQEVLPNNNEDKKIKIQELSQKFVDKDVLVVDLLPPNMQKEELNSILDRFVDPSLGLSIDGKLAYLVNERLHPWHRIFGEEVLNSKKEIIRLITDNVNVIVPAIADHTSIKDLSKKEWLLHFYMHQALDPKGADAVDTVTRTFWELVVSHMDKDVPEGFFTIKYSKTNEVSGNELKSGFLNCLKLLYNLSYALKNDNPALKSAETAIKALETVCKNPQPDNKPNDETKVKAKTKEEILQDALKATLGLFYPAEDLTIEEGFSLKEPTDDEIGKKDDCYATVTVIKKITEKETLSFSITQDTGHAKVIFEPIVFNKLDDDLKKFVETEPSLQPFAYKFRKDLELSFRLEPHIKYKYSKYTTVNKKNYLRKKIKPISWMLFDLKPKEIKECVPAKIRNTQFFQNYEALRFLRTMQGEARNTDRISDERTSGCVGSNIKINNKKKLLSTFIYENYVSRLGDNSAFEFFKNWKKPKTKRKSKPKSKTKPNTKPKDTQFIDKKTNTYSDNVIESAQKIEAIANDSNGIKYFYTRATPDNPDNKEILIFPLNLNSLATWTIPATVKINGEEFTVVGTPSYCEINVENIIMSPEIEKFAFKGKFPLTESINFENSQNLKSLTFGEDSFCNTLLKEIIVPNSVTELSIESRAFEDCKSLKELIVSGNEINIEKSAFNGCKSLEKCEIVGNYTELYIDDYVFKDCNALQQVKFFSNLKTLDIGERTFKDCTSLKEIIIPGGVTVISLGDNALAGCKSLIKFEIPDSVTELYIGTNAFIDCDSFETIVIPNSVTKLSIPWGAVLGYTSSKKVEIPSSVVSLTLLREVWETQELLDDQYKGIIKIKIPEHVKDLTIAKWAFSESNSSSFEVPLGQNVVIGKDAFWRCKLLSKVFINASNLKIESSAFCDCQALKKVIGPPNISEAELKDFEKLGIEYVNNELNL